MFGRAMRTAALAAALAAIAAGCSKSEPDQAPVACLSGPPVYLSALRQAPGEVRLQGETPISDCLPSGQGGGELANVGSTMVATATRLNAEALKDPTGPETLELGYLLGAVQRGAEETGGIHQDLVRRLNTAARYSPSGLPPAEFERTFGRGFAAGEESG
jgi:hypothetical protein